MDFIDLRSDTVSHPTPEMRQAMANAELGDDVYGDDPTVNRLQELAAEKLGKEAGLFVTSGTMGNLVAVLAHCRVVMKSLWGPWRILLPTNRAEFPPLGGVFPAYHTQSTGWHLETGRYRAAIRGEDVHFPVSRLVFLENTQNRCGGVC